MASEEDEKILVTRLKQDDIHAFDELYNRYSSKLYFFSLSLLKNDDDAKEVVQEVFYRIWKKRYEADSSKSIKSFLFTITHNLIIDLLRLRLKDKKFREHLILDSDEYFLPQNPIDYETLDQRIKDAVDQLPEKRKVIFKMSREDGYSHKQIAEKLGLSVKTVENQINLTLRHLKKQIGTDFLIMVWWIINM